METGINYVLIGVLLVLMLAAIEGYKKGFLRVVVSFVGVVAVLFLVIKISPAVNSFIINNTEVYEKVRSKIVSVYIDEKVQNATKEQESDTIKSYRFPEVLTDELVINNTQDMYDALSVSIFSEYIAGFLSKMVIKIGTFVGLFILFNLILWIISIAAKILDKIPVLKTFNKLLGMIAGLVLGLVAVWTFFLISIVFLGNSIATTILSQINGSSLLSFLFNNNVLLDILKRI